MPPGVNGDGERAPAAAFRAAITAVAHYVPPLMVPNSFYASRLGTTDEWIQSRTGIRERRIAPEGGTSDLIVPAVQACLAQRGIGVDEIDCIIVATITPDYLFPPTAALVARKLGMSGVCGWDLSAACSGFVFALNSAVALVESGRFRRVLVCGADRMSTLADPSDRGTAVLFGDAAGVVLLERSYGDVGILDLICRLAPVDERVLYMAAGGSVMPASVASVAARQHYLVQDGAAVFKAAVSGMTDAVLELLERNSLSVADIDWLVPHQANLRIIQAVGRRLGVPLDKVAVNIERFGNTSAATIPVCLSEFANRRSFRLGDTIVLASFGAGFTVGAVYLKWAIHSDCAAGAEHSTTNGVATG